MPQGAQNHCFGFAWRSHYCKVIFLIIIVVLVLQYATITSMSKKNLNRIVSPSLTWISQSLQEKLGIQDSKLTTASSDLGSHNSFSNSTTSSISKHSKSKSFPSEIQHLNVTNLIVTSRSNSSSELPLCPLVPPKLVGRLKVLNENVPTFEELEKMFPELMPGGRYKPPECIARHKVAVVVPYRDREEHLRIFLHNIIPILMRQQIDFGIYIVEETAGTKFNRAMLMNIGFVEALKQYDYGCFIFHDVDLIPEDDRNLYTCPEQPRHMSVAIDIMKYRLPYKDIFGGVSALTRKHMEVLNGFSNEFWGWGGEDDDMANRIKYHGFKISRYSANVARYTMLKHQKDTPNPERYKKLYKGKSRFKNDGLSNLKYDRMDIVLKKLYTWVLVDISPLNKK